MTVMASGVKYHFKKRALLCLCQMYLCDLDITHICHVISQQVLVSSGLQ